MFDIPIYCQTRNEGVSIATGDTGLKVIDLHFSVHHTRAITIISKYEQLLCYYPWPFEQKHSRHAELIR